MKRREFALLFSLSVLVGCVNEHTSTFESNTVTLRAVVPSATRTLFDGSKSEWQAGDVLSVAADNDNSLHTFTYQSGDTFSSTTASYQGAQSIYALYAAESGAQLNATTYQATATLGAAEQIAVPTSPAAHIADYDVMYGRGDVVANGVEVAMHHSVVALEINITNDTAKSLDIKSVTITAPAGVSLVRKHLIDIAAGTIAPVEDNAASSTITVTYADNALLTLAASESAKVWAATAPFVVAAEGEITLDIATADGVTYRCVKRMPAQKEFKAGSIMSTSLSLEADSSQIDIAWNFSSAGTLPNDFPVYVKNGSNNTKSGTYSLGAYDFVFNYGVPYYYYDGGVNYIRFEGVKPPLTAEVTLPKIENYILANVKLASISDNYTRRRCQFTITNGGESAGDDFSKVLNAEIWRFDTSGFTSSNNHTIVVSGTVANAKDADMTHLSLCYTK